MISTLLRELELTWNFVLRNFLWRHLTYNLILMLLVPFADTLNIDGTVGGQTQLDCPIACGKCQPGCEDLDTANEMFCSEVIHFDLCNTTRFVDSDPELNLIT